MEHFIEQMNRLDQLLDQLEAQAGERVRAQAEFRQASQVKTAALQQEMKKMESLLTEAALIAKPATASQQEAAPMRRSGTDG